MNDSVIVLADTKKEKVCICLEKIRPWLENVASVSGFYQNIEEIPISELSKNRYLIVLGGDGWILRTARFVKSKIPVIGVNFGKLGFLAEFNMDNFPQEFAKIWDGKCYISSRMMLQCRIFRQDSCIFEDTALNDAVIKNTGKTRVLQISLFLDGDLVSQYGGDGIIVASPVGSTAYSLSAGGPILSPDVSGLLVTPICPHVLTLRPFIVHESNKIQIQCSSNIVSEHTLTLDGQVDVVLHPNDVVEISKANCYFHLVKTEKKNFFHILQEKLNWGE
ncbi:MAG TPA: NAD(+)/NADH kinase [Planctomycetota bacterium]|nr:NAD(+)/NADH kinase [Planctomycetota bacterium]